MNPSFIQTPHLLWGSGALSAASLVQKSTCIGDLPDVFANELARDALPADLVIYRVEMVESSSREGELYTGVTHINPGRVGNEFFMTRGHFHARREQGEVYIGLRGCGLLLLQNEAGEAHLEEVFTGSVHIIPGYTAHRLINTGDEILSTLAVWPCTAGHDYAALPQGFALRVVEENGEIMAKEVQNG